MACVLVAVLAAACSANPSATTSTTSLSDGPTPSPSPIVLTDYPAGFPTSYANEVDQGPVLLQPVPGGLRHDSSGTLRADDGTTGTYTASWIENRVPAATATCGGSTWKNVFIAEAPAMTMNLTFPDWGAAVLMTTDRVVVYPSSRNGSSPAACDQTISGTYQFDFTGGAIKQLMSGTWGWAAGGRLVFAPAQPAAGS
jgi:hypothetical protein